MTVITADPAMEIADRVGIEGKVLQAVDVLGADGIFRPYQRRAVELSHVHELLVVPKGRRTGLTWAFAGDDAITAATRAGQGGDDVLYIGPSFDMAREYIEACAGFAKAFMGIDALVGETIFNDEDVTRPGETRQIKAFRIDFASGHKILALTSAPRSLRGRQGRVRIDEAAFVDNLAELLKAALALTMLGSHVVVISTHNGVDNEFNKLIQEIQKGDREGHVFEVPFKLAVEQGMYESTATVRGWELTQQAKDTWVRKIYKRYSSAAAEELDAIPSRSSGSWLSYDLIERAEDPTIPVLRLACEPSFTLLPDHKREVFIAKWCEEHLAPLLADLGQLQIGVGGDFARFADVSAMWLLQELMNRAWRTPFVLEMRRVPYREQEFVWEFVLSRLRVWRAKIDANGNGGYLAERMVQIFGAARVEGVLAKAEWWKLQGTPLLGRFESEGRITIPQDAGVASDLRMVKVVDGAPKIAEERVTAGDGEVDEGKRHGDDAVALFHASAALREGGVAAPVAATTGPTGAPPGFLGEDFLDPYATLNFAGY
ncbi:hypothetical protein [Caulobacter segnis]|uniref:Mu-like prophage FluMu protein gp28 n=1 Tax=Caulobacter segnis TaxID=88688 RepID=A0A2W5UZ68_9CAUL|nr:hypothetical protein [Caulobacter segnis]PZR32282.1 MAG: hypothetical protein DI526_17050 [Caulobacter segnis]